MGKRPRQEAPHFALEQELLVGDIRLVGGMDEVGRGALAGPVSVGVAVVTDPVPDIPEHLRDSKLLTPARRDALRPVLLNWGVDRAVGHASNTEIDRLGIVGALRLAGERALAALQRQPEAIILDGSHDWLSRPVNELDLFGTDITGATSGGTSPGEAPFTHGFSGKVVTQVKGDLMCASVAAASVLAKTERDALMASYAVGDSRYGWAENKGYGAKAHRDALRHHGVSSLHRLSWKLPGKDHAQ